VSEYEFEVTDRLSDRHPVTALRVHAAAGCGRSFRDVAAVLEPDGPQPCLLLPDPLGVSAVVQILALLNDRRAALRLPPVGD
jgi:hypothetical protein